MGKRRLESALQMYREQNPDEEPPAVRWLPFQLNPDLPEEGISRQDYIERKWGKAGNKYERVAAVGREVGIDFKFDDIKVQPNTVNAHRLMLYGTKHGREDAVAESLFKAYFMEGADLTARKTLADIGERAGLERDLLEKYLDSDEDTAEILKGDLEARQGGVNGVPFFIFNQKAAISGAHEPETLLKAMIESTKN
ncbi:MAG: DsbA family oxidoreductase [Burkholderiales bacterium]